MVEHFYAWAIDTKEHGYIGRFWHFGKPPDIPLNSLGCLISLFETRTIARDALQYVRGAYKKAKVVRVRIYIVQGDSHA